MTATELLVSSESAEAYAAAWMPRPESTTAVVAAAGRGTRLGFHLPKVLYPMNGRTVLEWIAARLSGFAGALTLVLSPEGEQAVDTSTIELPMPMTVAVQNEPRGMADAILSAWPVLPVAAGADTLVVVWGDQIGITRSTIARALAVHAGHALAPAVTIPLAAVDAPYVHYEFSPGGRLAGVLQRREGDALPASGLADCGCFVLSTRVVLPMLKHLADTGQITGRSSGEQNFLQALPLLAREVPVVGVLGATLADTIGLNSVADLDRLAHVAEPRRLPEP